MSGRPFQSAWTFPETMSPNLDDGRSAAESEGERPRKRARTDRNDNNIESPSLRSLRASISPPRSRSTSDQTSSTPAAKVEQIDIQSEAVKDSPAPFLSGSCVPSPFHLSKIRDLSEPLNRDAVSLQSLICDPMISELWEFNFMHDLAWLLSNMDPDTRDSTRIHVVHGYWKSDSGLELKESAPKYPNVQLHCAYMPEMFGTHHTKMMITIRHDDQAQIIITTANMIPADWTNMTQALWKSPLLPLLMGASRSDSNQVQGTNDAPFGSGLRFKFDFLSYLRAYNVQRRTVTLPLIEQLLKYDFSSIRGALVGHVPGKYPVEGNRTLFGWPAVKAILKTVTVSSKPDLKPEIVSQMSSIATLGPTTAWLMGTLFGSLNQSENDPGTGKKTKLSVVYPTPDEIRRSLDGYYSGGSIHMRIQSAAQQKQLQYMRPMMRHWAGDEHDRPESLKPVREAGRKRAAPHIKTYIRFADAQKTIIDWALVTSANLSKQAWGEKTNKDDMVRISSYELGVLVAPQFYGDNVVMVPTFQTDMPARPEGVPPEKVILGCRMPYDLPLVPYKPNEKPWCQTETHPEPDWHGLMWNIP